MTLHRYATLPFGLALLVILSLAPAVGAQIAVSGNDNKVVNVNGVVKVAPGARPIVLDIASNGAFAVVGNLAGGPTGDSDSISLIDLTAKPPRVVDTIGVLGATAEGLKDSPFYNDAGKLVIVRVTGKTLSRVAEAPIGHWSQGAAFAPDDGKTILVGNMIER
jgi:hypothetical protein